MGKNVIARLLQRAALVAVFAVALIPQQAEAAKPKRGYYTAKTSEGLAYAEVNKKGIVTDYRGVCDPLKPDRFHNIYGYTADKHFPVRHGSFDYKGTVTVFDGYVNGRADAEISGKFTDHGKRWHGKAVVDGCHTEKFEGGYRGEAIL